LVRGGDCQLIAMDHVRCRIRDRVAEFSTALKSRSGTGRDGGPFSAPADRAAFNSEEPVMRVLNFFIAVSGLTTIFAGIAVMSALYTSVLQSTLQSRPAVTTSMQN
jgi:hypothetical protein